LGTTAAAVSPTAFNAGHAGDAPHVLGHRGVHLLNVGLGVSEPRGELGERGGEAELVVAGVDTSSSWPRRMFWVKACPAVTMRAERSHFRPRIGLSLALSL
jgi:hypothetical protein